MDPKLLDRLIDSACAASARARAALLLGTSLTFIFGASIYICSVGWQINQLRNRAILLRYAEIAERDPEGFWKAATPDTLMGNTMSGHGPLGYLKELAPAKSGAATTQHSQLKAAVYKELESFIGKRVELETLHVPVLGISMVASDIGIIGGAALAIVGFWLAVMSRREKEILNEFVHDIPGGYAVRSTLSKEQHVYAYKAIIHSMVFNTSSQRSPVNFLTAMLLAAPVALFFSNAILTLCQAAASGILSSTVNRAVVEILIALLVGVSWGSAFLSQYGIVMRLQKWRAQVDG